VLLNSASSRPGQSGQSFAGLMLLALASICQSSFGDQLIRPLAMASPSNALTRNDWSFRFKPVWADEDYADYYYEVAPAFATAGRTSYDASSGYLGSEFRLGLERQITERLRFDGSAKLWINNGAENQRSPLFVDDHGVSLQAAFIWTLGTSERRGSAP